MDFFQRQEIARRNTRWLEVYFALAVLGTVLAVYGAALLFVNVEASQGRDSTESVQLWDPQLFLGVSLVTCLIIFCGSMYKISALSGGGSAVAEMLGGRPIDVHSSDPDERKLLNVVEEMSIASGTPIPQVYLLPGESGINAFAAGHTTGDMVICVTAGTLRYLKRDELQGVIGHEFSHILNGDMRLNLRLMGLVFGILCLAMIGNILMRTRGERNPLPLLGLALLLVGYIGVFFGKLIKSAVSRQREFLADASAVQFTRNPAGLANALKKVGSSGSRIDDANAEDASHFFFANGLTESAFEWMSTHPSLEERIRELDPAWDGKFLPVQVVSAVTGETEVEGAARKPGFASPLGMIATPILMAGAGAAAFPSAGLLPHVGAPTARHLDYAADVMAKMPGPLVAAARNPMGAVALVYALLFSPEETLRKAQVEQLQLADPVIYGETTRLLPVLKTLESRARLPLATLAISSLRALSAAQYEQFSITIGAIMESNGPTDLFAYVLQKIVRRRLEPCFRPAAKTVPQYYALKPLLSDCAVLVSALACAGQTEPADIKNAFNQGVAQLNLSPDDLQLDTSACDLTRIDAALDRLNQAAPQIKKAVLNACAETVAADGVIQENEAELLRAIADTLDCPIPPFLKVC